MLSGYVFQCDSFLLCILPLFVRHTQLLRLVDRILPLDCFVALKDSF